MHLNFDFSAVQILWTLTFAALLVLLVVLIGRERIRRYPWFTATIAMMALRLVASRLLYGRMAPVVASEIFLALSDVATIIALGVVVEMARRAFSGAKTAAWVAGSVLMLAIAGVVLAKWGPWPSIKTLLGASTLEAMRVMQLFAQKGDLLADLLTIQLGVLVVLLGRRFGAGWRSHTQQIVIGLSTASISQEAVRAIWQEIAIHTTIHSTDEYTRAMNLQEKFYNANNVVYIAVLAWWILCLWFDEPGAVKAVNSGQEAADSETPAPKIKDDSTGADTATDY